MILLRSFLSGHIRIKRTLEYYDAGIGPRVPFGGGFGPTVSANFATALNDYTTLSSTSTMPTGGSISRAGNAMLYAVDGGVAKLTYAPNNLVLSSNNLGSATYWVSAKQGVGLDAVLTPNYAADPFGGNTAARWQLDLGGGTTSSDRSRVTTVSTISVAIGTTYILSMWIKSNTASSYIIRFQTSGVGTFVDITVTPTWQRFYYLGAAAASASSPFFGLLGGLGLSSTADLLVYGAQLEAVTYATTPAPYNATTTSAYYGPRFDYDPRPSLTGTASIAGSAVTLPAIFNDGTPASSIDNAYVGQTITVGGTGYPVTAYVGSTRIATVTGTPTSGSQSFTLTNPGYLLNRGLLVEGQLQQLVSYSENIQVHWFNAGGGGTEASTTVSPAGVANAYSTTYGTTTSGRYSQSISYAGNTVYTISTYVKLTSGSSGQAWVGSADAIWGATTTNFVRFNLATLSFDAISAGSIAQGFQSVGNGWYRVWTVGRTIASPGSGSIVAYNNTSGATIAFWGAQVEARAFPTSYLPTQGGTSPFATRAAETFSLTGYANRLVEAYYIDEETGGSYSGNSALSTGTVTISPPTFGWVTSLRAYTNAYAGSISTPSWLSFSRAGNAMYYDSTGTLTFAANNLLLNTATLSTQTVTTGIIPTCDVILSFKGTGSVAISGGYTGTLAGTGASDRVFLKFTTTTASLTFTVTGTVTEAQLERVTYQTQPSLYVANTGSQSYGPRYDFDPSTVPATPRGLLIEEQRANIFADSRPVNWGQAATTSTTSGTSPDGTANATLIVPTTASAQHFVSTSVVSSGTTTFSVYLKAAGYNWVALVGSGGAFTTFNLATGTVETPGAGVTAAIQSVGNGWYRCSVTQAYVGGTSYIFIEPSNSQVTWSGDGVSGVYAYGAQLEAGSFATSYIPTTTASVTRAADVAQLTGSALTTAGAATGSAIVQTTLWQNSTAAARDLLSSATTRRLLYSNSSNTVLSSTDGTTGLNATIGGSGTFTGGAVRSAVAWDASGRSLIANNGTLTSDAVNLSTGATATLGGYGTTTTFDGWIASMALYNQRLPDAILKQKSSVGAPY